MKLHLLVLPALWATSLFASVSSNVPQVIGDVTYWLKIDSDQSESGKEWNFETDAPPPLLPNDALKIARQSIRENRIADREWKIISISIKQTESTINGVSSTYCYYLVKLSELLREGTPEYKRRMADNQTSLYSLEIAITMDGKAILPEKGKHLKELSPEAWKLYQQRNAHRNYD